MDNVFDKDYLCHQFDVEGSKIDEVALLEDDWTFYMAFEKYTQINDLWTFEDFEAFAKEYFAANKVY